jgi:hypothetical protein
MSSLVTASGQIGVASTAENVSWSGMSSAVRRLTQGALAPNPHTPVMH